MARGQDGNLPILDKVVQVPCGESFDDGIESNNSSFQTRCLGQCIDGFDKFVFEVIDIVWTFFGTTAIDTIVLIGRIVSINHPWRLVRCNGSIVDWFIVRGRILVTFIVAMTTLWSYDVQRTATSNGREKKMTQSVNCYSNQRFGNVRPYLLICFFYHLSPLSLIQL